MRTRPPADFAGELPQCPVRQETLAGELRTPAFARLAAKAAAVLTAAVATAPEAPGAVRPVLTSARTVTRTGYLATKVTGGSGWKTLLAGVLLAVVGVVMATQGMIAIGLTGTIVALVGAYLIALGAWGIHRGALTAIAAITALAVPALLVFSWVRTQIWGNGKHANSGWVPRDVLPWLRDNWWAGLAVLGGIILLAVLFSLIPRRRPPRNPAPKKSPGPPAGSATESTDPPVSGGKPANAVAQAPGAAGPRRRRQKRNPRQLVRRQRSRWAGGESRTVRRRVGVQSGPYQRIGWPVTLVGWCARPTEVAVQLVTFNIASLDGRIAVSGSTPSWLDSTWKPLERFEPVDVMALHKARLSLQGSNSFTARSAGTADFGDYAGRGGSRRGLPAIEPAQP